MMNKSIKELHDLLINNQVTSEELIKESINKSHEIEEPVDNISFVE